MSAQCISYNEPWPSQSRYPEGARCPFSKKIVEIDACLVAAVKAVWECGIETVGSCCTHGFGKPEIIIKQNATTEEIQRARKAIATVDEREFVILSWTLNRYEDPQ